MNRSNNIDEEIERYFHQIELRANTPPVPDEYIDESTFEKIARHFADWQREKMEKDAITCNVLWYDGAYPDFSQEQFDEALGKIDAHVDDKIKIIILKDN